MIRWLDPAGAARLPVFRDGGWPRPSEPFSQEIAMMNQNAESVADLYIRRRADDLLETCLQGQGATITIRGIRQMGKTSLLDHALDSVKAIKQSALLDFQTM